MKRVRLVLGITTLLTGAQAFGFQAWDDKNKPELFEFDYDRSFESLPLNGQLKKVPWSGYYWPTYEGGITYRWNKETEHKHEKYGYSILTEDTIKSVKIADLSPAEKYDLYLGQFTFPLTNYERDRTKIMKTVPGSSDYEEGFKIPTWEGLCHAWAPVTLDYDNPAPVVIEGKKGHEIAFGSSDIKALLIYHLHINRSPKTKFLGSRCNLDFKKLKEKLDNNEITKEEYEKSVNSSDCSDTNAGAFHIVLANQMKRNEGFIVDVTRDFEVWNQPVIGYSSQVLSEKQGASEGAAPGTVKEVTVRTWMQYVVEVRQSWEKEMRREAYRFITYDYRLELNNEGKIIGGEWLTEERPDFIWKQHKTEFKGFFKDLETIYKKSVSYLDENSASTNTNDEDESEEERLERERREREEAERLERERREREEAERLERERREREEAERSDREELLKVKEAITYSSEIKESARFLKRKFRKRIGRRRGHRGHVGPRLKRNLRAVRHLLRASSNYERSLRVHKDLELVKNEFFTLRRTFQKASRTLKGGPRVQDEMDFIASTLRALESLYR